MGFPDKADKEFICNAEDSGSILEPGISLGEGMLPTPLFMGFSGGSDGKESTRNTGDLGSIPGLGRSPGGGHGHPLQYSCLENPMDRGAWRGLQSMGSHRVGHDLVTEHAHRLSSPTPLALSRPTTTILPCFISLVMLMQFQFMSTAKLCLLPLKLRFPAHCPDPLSTNPPYPTQLPKLSQHPVYVLACVSSFSLSVFIT